MWVIFEGTGSYRIDGFIFKAGATECNDEHVLERLRQADVPWITIQEDRSQPKVEEPEPEPAPEPVEYDYFNGRDGKWYFYQELSGELGQAGPFDTEEEVLAAIEEARTQVPLADEVETGLESGTTTTDDVKADAFECRGDGCDRVFKSANGRANHERVKHPELGKDAKPLRQPDPLAIEPEDDGDEG